MNDLSARKYTYWNISSGEDLDDIYKESWVCYLIDVCFFNSDEGLSNKLQDYTLYQMEKLNLIVHWIYFNTNKL